MNARQSGGWLAVARARDLRRPRRVIIGGAPYVLFRTPAGPQCLSDVCPHRGAPLSGGRVVADAIECPYHGWRFDGSGCCRAMPGLREAVPRALVPRLTVREFEGLVFVRGDPACDPYAGVLAGAANMTIVLEATVRSTLAEVAENILDATHTHFTHKGVLRGLSSRRYAVNVTVTGGDGWVEARYEGEPRQEGLVSRLLEGERSISVGRFLAPGIAELEFWGPRRINLATTFHLRQETADAVRGLAILGAPRSGPFDIVKAALFKPFFRIALRQDQRILEAAQANRELAPRPPLIGPLDVMRPHIDAILAGRRPTVADTPASLAMEL